MSSAGREDAAHPLAQLILAEKARTCGAVSQQSYADLHRVRFADILRVCRSEVPASNARVLDIGRSELTVHLASAYPDIRTLGLDTAQDDGGHREVSKLDRVPHIVFNLLDADTVSCWPQSRPFDLIVFSEVIEHLSVAPEFVFACLSSLLADDGVLVCTTPNAANLGKRLKLAMGRNPYERLRLYATNPGHFREYTRQELCEIAASVGLRCTNHFYCNWFGPSGNPLRAGLLRMLHAYPPFRLFQVCVFTRNRETQARPG